MNRILVSSDLSAIVHYVPYTHHLTLESALRVSWWHVANQDRNLKTSVKMDTKYSSEFPAKPQASYRTVAWFIIFAAAAMIVGVLLMI